jgi:excinuclease ABC subunit C
VKEKVRAMPDEPGVYLMKDGRGRVIYVGKAKRLTSRVRSYFGRGERLDAKTERLVDAVRDLDFMVTRNEVEALVLECTLIKEHRPRYNIRLKDDKRYPFIKITTNEAFPRLLLVRSVENDGAEYFGPYTDVKAVRRMLRTMKTVFPLRNCIGGRFAERERECLNFHIDRCLGPCTGRVTEEAYGQIVKQVRLYLKGRGDELRCLLEARMRSLSERRCYEEAAKVRDQIETLDRVAGQQLSVSPDAGDKDVVAMAREGDTACAVVMKIREGKLLGTEAFFMPVGSGDEFTDIYDTFIKIYYHAATDVPPRIVTQVAPGERGLVEDWLSGKRKTRVRLVRPLRGRLRRLVELAQKNASLKIISQQKADKRSSAILTELKEKLGLVSTPDRIEAFDISNIQGIDAVGSMVTFKGARPLKSGYRHFKIRSVEGSNDFAMLEEVIERRVKHIRDGRDRAPDLILVDGGRGQVSAARKALNASEISSIPIIGLAKKDEVVYVEGDPEPRRLPRRDMSLRFLQRVRNEAHRFAIEYHRKLRSKRVEYSELDAIPGIGEARKTLLLVEFGSVEALKRASESEIAAVNGIGGKIAQTVYRHLHER